MRVHLLKQRTILTCCPDSYCEGLGQFSQVICAAPPVEIWERCDKFRGYPLKTQVGRRLSWQTDMGMADLRATFVRGQKHKLSVYIHQMCTLMMFNNAHRLNEKGTGHGSIPDLQEEVLPVMKLMIA